MADAINQVFQLTRLAALMGFIPGFRQRVLRPGGWTFLSTMQRATEMSHLRSENIS